jgi:hypothetical protein
MSGTNLDTERMYVIDGNPIILGKTVPGWRLHGEAVMKMLEGYSHTKAETNERDKDYGWHEGMLRYTVEVPGAGPITFYLDRYDSGENTHNYSDVHIIANGDEETRRTLENIFGTGLKEIEDVRKGVRDNDQFTRSLKAALESPEMENFRIGVCGGHN